MRASKIELSLPLDSKISSAFCQSLNKTFLFFFFLKNFDVCKLFVLGEISNNYPTISKISKDFFKMSRKIKREPMFIVSEIWLAIRERLQMNRPIHPLLSPESFAAEKRLCGKAQIHRRRLPT